jgi:tripartite-type tricarboxylate transporter receptor subunit TctC
MATRQTKGLLMLIGIFCTLVVILTASTLTAAPPPTSSSSKVADFYKGKTIKLMLGFDPGNMSDTWARIIAPYLTKQIGANVVVVNEGGGGGLVARNGLFKLTKPDGLTIMMDPSGALWPSWLLDQEGVQYDVTKFEYLGGINAAYMGLFVNPKGPYTSVEALKKADKPIKFAVSGVASLPAVTLLNTIEVLKLNAMVGPGYKNTAAVATAVMQGESDGGSCDLQAALNYEKNGQAKVLFIEGYERDPNFPNVPSLADFAKIPDPAMKLLKGLPYNGRVFFAPPGTPKETVQFLQENIAATLANKDLQSAIAKLATYWPGTLSGEEVRKMAIDVGQNKSASLNYYKSLVAKYVK